MDLTGEDGPLPESLDEIVQLIQQLYAANQDPTSTSRIQEVLQQVQRSPNGWELANELLRYGDKEVQFFGALTFTVKINSDWEGLEEEDQMVLLNRLTSWLSHLVSTPTAPFVIRKMCSTLAVFFIHFPRLWRRCIRHLVCCICAQPIPLEAIDQQPPTSEIIRNAPMEKRIPLLWFCSTLVQEVGKLDSKFIQNAEVHQIVKENTVDAVAVISDALNATGQDIEQVVQEDVDPNYVCLGLECYQAWVFFALKSSFDTAMDFSELTPLTQVAIMWLTAPAIFETACEVLTEVLTSHTKFLGKDDIATIGNVLSSPWGIQHFEELRSGDSDPDESIAFGRLVISFAELRMKDLLRDPNSPQSSAILQMMHGMLTCPGYPVEDDPYCTLSFEFWDSLVEMVIDAEYEEGIDPALLAEAKKHAFLAVEEYWNKLKIPPPEVAAQWSKDSCEGFASFRKDVSEFIESAYPALQIEMLNKLTRHVTDIVGEPVWADVEATLFCINALGDLLTGHPQEFVCLASLFGSSVFRMLANTELNIPLKPRQTAVTLIGSYASFFEQNVEYLPTVLNFLFTSINNAHLARSASKSIVGLCSSCRTYLIGELQTFLVQIELFSNQTNVDTVVKEKVLSGIAYVIQALPSDELRLGPLTMILGFVEKDIQRSMMMLGQGERDDAKEVALFALRCLVGIARAMQSVDDMTEPAHVETNTNFWQHGEGSQVQQAVILTMQTMLTAFEEDGEIIDEICGIVKAGLLEQTPGPFVFCSSVVVDFVVNRGVRSVRVESVLAIAGTFVCTQSMTLQENIVQTQRLVEFVLAVVENVHVPSSDSIASPAAIEFLQLLVNKSLGHLISIPQSRLENVLIFTLEAMSCQETLIKKSAAKFWTALLSVQPAEQEVRNALDEILQVCGPRLGEKLVMQLGGGCYRSELDMLAEPLKKLVIRSPRAKKWLQDVLDVEGVPSKRLQPQDKRMFLERLFMLRGGKQTNTLVREFWVKSRGNELFGYTG